MNYIGFIVPVLFVGLGFAYQFWMRGRAATALANAGPSFNAFFERTGYRYVDIQHLPPEAQTQRAMDAAKTAATGNGKLHYVRNFHGLPVHYISSSGREDRGGQTVFYVSNQWEAPVPTMPRVPMHIADKSLDSTLKAVGDFFSSSKRVFQPKCSQRVTTGIPLIDDKFVVFGEDPHAVRAALHQNPALVQLLAGWAEVDVSIAGDRALFADPLQKNMQAAMGGMIGNMAMGLDYGKRTELSIPVHDRVAELLATLVRASV